MPKTITRLRKSKFVRLFDKTPDSVVCPHFYELILSNGCIYDCSYCYLKLTFRGKNTPTLFNNEWAEIENELASIPFGVFSTGVLQSYNGDVDLNKKLAKWEHYYNFQRPHGGLSGKAPYEALRERLK